MFTFTMIHGYISKIDTEIYIYIYICMYIYKLKNPHLNVKWSEYTNKKNEFERTKTLL